MENARPSKATRANSVLHRLSVVYPAGNGTAVVWGERPGVDRKKLNEAIMARWVQRHPELSAIEQCCFVTPPNDPAAIARVEMFGGEFCGNAARSAVLLLTEGKDGKGLIEVSGAPRSLPFEVSNGSVAVSMPVLATDAVQRIDEGILVNIGGIVHLVQNDLPQLATSPRQVLGELLLRNVHNLRFEAAVGVSQFDKQTGTARFSVWVKNVDTIFDETACGSGTSAIAVATAAENRRSVKMSIRQPSRDSIIGEAMYDPGSQRVFESRISGPAKVLFDGEFDLGDPQVFSMDMSPFR